METDVDLLARLHDGDESAFVLLVTRYEASLLRFARTLVQSEAVAEEAVQDTWMGVVRGVERFEGRSSFKTWLFRILVNRARSAGTREQRYVAVGSERAVDASRFDGRGQWAEPVERWVEESETRLDAAKWSPVLKIALDALPDRQRQVVLMRDVEGFSNSDVCQVLGISSANQRLLLHRGRNRLRDALEAAMKGR